MTDDSKNEENPFLRNRKAKNEPNNSFALYSPDKYVDDVSLYMAWQNMCWMNYSQAMMHQQFMMHNNVCSQQPQQQPTVIIQQQDIPSQQLHETVKLASIQKRLLAETVDFFLMAFVKVVILLYCYGEDYFTHFSYVAVLDDTANASDVEWMLIHALIFRVAVIAYEAYMLSGTLPFSRGCTLGKRIMGLEVVRAEFQEHDPVEQTVRLAPKPLGALRSCLRSFIKNLCISFLFPTVFPMLLVALHNRLLYDVAVDGVVIETPRRDRQRNN